MFVLWFKGVSEEGMTGISMFVCADDREEEGCSRWIPKYTGIMS
jgi:hypothetical protein